MEGPSFAIVLHQLHLNCHLVILDFITGSSNYTVGNRQSNNATLRLVPVFVCQGVQNDTIFGFRIPFIVYALDLLYAALLIIPTLALALCNKGQAMAQVLLAHHLR